MPNGRCELKSTDAISISGGKLRDEYFLEYEMVTKQNEFREKSVKDHKIDLNKNLDQNLTNLIKTEITNQPNDLVNKADLSPINQITLNFDPSHQTFFVALTAALSVALCFALYCAYKTWKERNQKHNQIEGSTIFELLKLITT